MLHVRVQYCTYCMYVHCTIVHTLDIYKINNLPDSKLFNSIDLEVRTHISIYFVKHLNLI